MNTHERRQADVVCERSAKLVTQSPRHHRQSAAKLPYSSSPSSQMQMQHDDNHQQIPRSGAADRNDFFETLHWPVVRSRSSPSEHQVNRPVKSTTSGKIRQLSPSDFPYPHPRPPSHPQAIASHPAGSYRSAHEDRPGLPGRGYFDCMRDSAAHITFRDSSK
jgi:hypothetical protein